MIYVFIDGASRGNPGDAGAAAVFKDSNGRVMERHGEYLGRATNNEAEYKALLLALQIAKRKGYQYLKIHTDSQLLERQLKGLYRVKSERLKGFFREAAGLCRTFKQCEIVGIDRGENSEADRLANEAIDRHIKGVLK